VLIADGVGLGKTIEAALIARELASRRDACRTLVLVPAGLRDQWAHELDAQVGLHAVQADAAWLRAMGAELPAGVNPWSMPGVYIASLDFAKRPEVLQPIEETSWDLTVIDEAHLASIGTDRRAAAHAIASRSRRVLLLTATPHDGAADEFDALTRIGQIAEGRSPLAVFRRSRSDIGTGLQRRTALLRVALSASERRMHDLLDCYTAEVWNEARRRRDSRARLMSIVLRKRALSSAASLAASVRRRLELLAGTAPEPAYQLPLPLADEDPIDEDAAPSDVLAAPGIPNPRREHRWLASIAQAAITASGAESKTRRLLALLARIREPFILFTEYRDTLNRLERAIAVTGRPVVVLHGGLDARERRRVQDRFNRGGVALLATDAAAEGLNLHHHCRLVFHYELPWSAARIEQRAGRVDRLGQTRRVHEIALVASDTVERLVLAPLVRRAVRAKHAGRPATGLLARLTELHVAGTIFGDPASPPAESHAPRFDALSIDLRIEAAAETARLEWLRDLRGSARAARPSAAFTVVKRQGSAVPRTLALAVVVSLRDAIGRIVHAEPKVIRLADWRNFTRDDLPALAGASARPDDREAILRLLRGLELDTPTALANTFKDVGTEVLRRVEASHSRYLEAARERELDLRVVQPSASARLVQAGLFDRRALRELAHREHVLTTLSQDASVRLEASASASLTAEVHLLAAVAIDWKAR